MTSNESLTHEGNKAMTKNTKVCECCKGNGENQSEWPNGCDWCGLGRQAAIERVDAEREANTVVGQATYTNRVTGEVYKMGFDYEPGPDTTQLSRAWDLVKTVASLKGWNAVDIAVKVGW